MSATCETATFLAAIVSGVIPLASLFLLHVPIYLLSYLRRSMALITECDNCCSHPKHVRCPNIDASPQQYWSTHRKPHRTCQAQGRALIVLTSQFGDLKSGTCAIFLQDQVCGRAEFSRLTLLGASAHEGTKLSPCCRIAAKVLRST